MRRFFYGYAVLMGVSLLFPSSLYQSAIADEEQPETEVLTIGSKAPSLDVEHWVSDGHGKFKPVTSFEAGKVYVVEFWATWCGPCVATIPHLDKLHEELKNSGVVFIGQNCMEKDTSKVKPFVDKMGEKMSYRVATDDTSSEPNGYMAVNWMEAAEQRGIPTAFIVGKDGKIAWIGHPAGLEADLLKQVAAGTFDSSKAAAMQEQQEAAQAAMEKAGAKLSKAINSKDWDQATGILDDMEKETPSLAPQLMGARMHIAVEKGDSGEVVKVMEKMMAGPAGESAQAINQLVWSIATKLKNPSPEVLTAAAKAAAKGIEKGDDSGALLDTLARVQFLQGQKEEAVKTQEKAVAAAGDDLKKDLEKTLASYKEGKLPDAE